MHEIKLEPQGWCFQAPPGVTLLKAAQGAGVRLPRSCQNGTCRACLCRLRSGTVSYLIEWPGLSAEEKAQGWVLPCVACATSAVVLAVPEARQGLAPAG